MVSKRCQLGNKWRQEGVIGCQEDVRYVSGGVRCQVSGMWLNFLLPSLPIPCFFIGCSCYLLFGMVWDFFSQSMYCALCVVCSVAQYQILISLRSNSLP